jgi:hypothetical protein
MQSLFGVSKLHISTFELKNEVNFNVLYTIYRNFGQFREVFLFVCLPLLEIELMAGVTDQQGMFTPPRHLIPPLVDP